MPLRAPIYLLLLLCVGSLGAWGWLRDAEKSRQIHSLDFVRQRAAFLDTENKRLAATLAAKDSAVSQVEENRQRDEIEQAVTRLSGLKFLRPVVFKEIPRTELPTILGEKLARQVPDQEFSNVGVELAALGLVPAGIDLKKVYLGLLGEQVGAFYDQHTHELFTFSEHPLSNSQNRVVMAHELTHALQDQHYDLLKLPLETKGNDDRALAASALVEGDATVVMNEYLLGDLSASVLRDSLSGAFSTDVRQLAAAPKYLRETLLFPYLQGQQFVAAVTAHGGKSALAEAFRNPPGSSSQIMHPEKYLATPREEPLAIEFPETKVLERLPVVDNVVGEFTAEQILELWTRDKARSGRVAEAWRGDRVLVYVDGPAHCLVWQTVWRDWESAMDYCRACQTGLIARYGNDTPPDPAHNLYVKDSAGSFNLSTGGRKVRMIHSATRTTLIDAPDSRWAGTLIQFATAPANHSQP